MLPEVHRWLGIALGTAVWLSQASTAVAGPAERFRPAASPGSHIATETSQVMPAWTPSATMWLSYGRMTRGTDGEGVAMMRRSSAHVVAGFGIAGWAQLDLDLPITIFQRARYDAGSSLEQAPVSSIGDLRIGAKGTILRTPRRGFGLGLALDVTAPTGEPAALSGWGAATVAPMVLLERAMVRGMLWSINLGYWVRPDFHHRGAVLGDAVIVRSGLRVPLSPRDQFSWVGEIDTLIGVTRGSSSPMSLRMGFRWQLRSGVTMALYGGGAAIPAVGVPDVQGLFTIGFAPPKRTHTQRAFEKTPPPSATEWARRSDRRQDLDAPPRKGSAPAKINPADPDGDGITALADQCPTVAEDMDGFEDDDGCPEVDNDRDGIRDREDLCPNAPEIINGYLDEDGCPDRRLAHGGETFLHFDARSFVPHLRFAPHSAELDEATRLALDEIAQLLRLNPWIERLGLTVYVAREERPAHEHQLARAQAEAVVSYLVARGIDAWRIHVAPARALPPGTEARVRLTLSHPTDGLRPFAPSPALTRPPVPSAPDPESPAAGPVLEAQGPPEGTPDGAAEKDASRKTHRSLRR